MKISSSFAACLLALAFALTAQAGDLDAPATKPVTVRSEIKRGYAAILTAAAASHTPSELTDAEEKILDKN